MTDTEKAIEDYRRRKRAEYMREYRQKNPEKYKEYMRKYREKTRISTALSVLNGEPKTENTAGSTIESTTLKTVKRCSLSRKHITKEKKKNRPRRNANGRF